MEWIKDLIIGGWGVILLVIYTGMIIVRTFKIVCESTLSKEHVAAHPEKYPNGYPVGIYRKTRLEFLGYGIREVFFDDNEEYFRLWDIVVVVFYSPAIAMSFIYLLMKAGALEFFPFLRRIFGVKLFRIRKPGVKKDEAATDGTN